MRPSIRAASPSAAGSTSHRCDPLEAVGEEWRHDFERAGLSASPAAPWSADALQQLHSACAGFLISPHRGLPRTHTPCGRRIRSSSQTARSTSALKATQDGMVRRPSPKGTRGFSCQQDA